MCIHVMTNNTNIPINLTQSVCQWVLPRHHDVSAPWTSPMTIAGFFLYPSQTRLSVCVYLCIFKMTSVNPANFINKPTSYNFQALILNVFRLFAFSLSYTAVHAGHLPRNGREILVRASRHLTAFGSCFVHFCAQRRTVDS